MKPSTLRSFLHAGLGLGLAAGLRTAEPVAPAPQSYVPPAASRPRLEPDDQNIVAGRLAGTWLPDAELGERLGTRVGESSITFAPDPAVLANIPQQLHEALAAFRFFEAGIVTFRRGEVVTRFPYALTNLSGNPCLFTFRERDGVPLGDIESAYLSVVPAKDSLDDLLFLGGDFDNEPFRALRRAQD